MLKTINRGACCNIFPPWMIYKSHGTEGNMGSLIPQGEDRWSTRWVTWIGWNMFHKSSGWHRVQEVAALLIPLHEGLREFEIVCPHYGESYQSFHHSPGLKLLLAICWDLFVKTLDWHNMLWVLFTGVADSLHPPTHVKKRKDGMDSVVWDPGGINFYPATNYHLAIPSAVVYQWQPPLLNYTEWGDPVHMPHTGEPTTQFPPMDDKRMNWDPGGNAPSPSLSSIATCIVSISRLQRWTFRSKVQYIPTGLLFSSSGEHTR
jgi:hypothetical protein